MDLSRRTWITIAAVGAIVLVLLVWPLPAGYGANATGAWYAFAAVVLAAGGLALAAAAVVYGRPTYLQWAEAQSRRPEIHMWIEVRNSTEPEDVEPFRKVEPDGRLRVDHAAFLVRVAVANDGTAPVAGILNFVVPVECRLHVVGNQPHAREVGFPSANDHIEPGTVRQVRWIVVERSFPAHAHVVAHARVAVPPDWRSVPLLADLTGDPDTDVKVRATVVIGGPEHLEA